MTEIPDHLMKRAEEARKAAASARGSVPPRMLGQSEERQRAREQRQLDEMVDDMQVVMGPVLDMITKMMSSMAGNAELLDAYADWFWNMHERLVTRGFTDDQAVSIVANMQFHSPGGK